MDPVTHTLSGMVIRRLGFSRKAAGLVIILSAIIPDIDYISRFWGVETYLLHHRGITHGFAALLLFPLLMGLLFRKKGGFFYYYCLSFLAYGAHISMDLMNQYGTRILAPLEETRYSFDLAFIVDPYITLGLLAAVLLGRQLRHKSRIIAVSVVVLIVAYTGARVFVKEGARQFLKSNIDANVYRLYPLPGELMRWWFVAKSGDKAETGFVDLLLKKVSPMGSYSLKNDAPEAVASAKQGVIRSFLTLTAYPHAEIKRQPDGTVVIWRDLAYAFLPGDVLTARTVMDRSGKIVSSGINLH